MSNPIAPPLLSVSGVEAVKQQFLAVFTRPLNLAFIDFTLDAPASELVISARSESDSGAASTYRGQYRWLYQKVSLAQVLPHPLALEVVYPLTFRQLRTVLLSQYGIHLEELEVALTPGGVGLSDDDNLTPPLGASYDQLRLYATNQSGRFVAGTSLGLIFVQPQRRVPLTALLDHNAPGVLGPLAAR